MIKKIIWSGLMVMMVIGRPSMSFDPQENPIVELGRVNVPRDLEWGIKILPKGEYKIALIRGRRSGVILATVKPDEAGMTNSWSVDAEVKESKENYPQPKVGVDVITESGEAFVQISVWMENKEYRSLWKCAGEPIAPGQRAKEEGPIDPVIETELKLIKEVHKLLDKFADKIWPGWDGYKTLDFILRFPNRDVVIVTENERLPSRFKTVAGEVISGKAVYIDRTKELRGRIGAAMSIGGHGDISGVTATLMSSLETAAGKPESIPAPDEKSPKSFDKDMRLTRMLIYVHEAYHSHQAKLMIEASKAGLLKPRGDMRPDFAANLEYSVYAELEGKALLKAYQEKDKAKALEFFKDALVAREIKHRAMPPGAAAADERTTQAEGTATYANLKMARLVEETGYRLEVPRDLPAVSEALGSIDEYIKKEGVSRLEEVAGVTLEIIQRPYIYGAFQCFLLDRFCPQWKNGFFEKDRTLDEVIAEFLPLSAEDKSRITERLQADSAFNEVRAKHSRVIQDRDDAVQSVTGRKGKKYVIDLKQAQRGFDIKPRNQDHVILYEGAQLFPHGLVKLIYGSLILESQDTPMRLSYSPPALEWVDTEAKAGEKGFDLKYEEKVEDLYKNITLTTRGFTMTAKAVKVVEMKSGEKVEDLNKNIKLKRKGSDQMLEVVKEADTVIISIID